MSRALAYMLLSLGVVSASTCPLKFVGNVKQFVVEQEDGKNRRTVPAVERAMTADDFYDYYSYSSHTGFEAAETSVMFLYRDLTNPTHLSFFWFHGVDEGFGNQGSARVDGLVTGVPSGTTIVQRDDHPGEWEWTTSTTLGELTGTGPHLGGRWTFNKNTDGGAVAGLPINENWEMKIQTNFIEGIDKWFFYFGDGSAPQAMNAAEPVYLHPVVTSVDLGVAAYPQTAGEETFCTLVQSDVEGEMLTYTFMWGDETPDTIVKKPAGSLACADHMFCGAASATCGGTVPRKVRVLVEKDGCDGVERVLANEDVAVCPPLNFVGNVKQFVVEQEDGKNRRTVPAVERAMTAADFYDYYSASSHTGFEAAETSVMFLYRDLNHPDELSFFWFHGVDEGFGSQGSARVDGLVTGVPSGTTIVQRDDHPGEWEWTTSTTLGELTGTGPHLGGRWTFNRNTDGGAVGGLPINKDWKMKIQTNFIEGIDKWFFYFGDGSAPQAMNAAEPVYLHPVVTSVDLGIAPYPKVAGAETFCTLVASEKNSESLTYTFMWGDGTPDTVVTRTAGSLACAEHDFCGPVSATCGGTVPRKVRVIVEKNGCDGVEKVLANEEITDVSCEATGVKVSVGGTTVPGTDLNGAAAYTGGGAVLTKIPENMRDMSAHTPGTVPKDTVIELTCCGTEVCEFIVSHYHCPPCSKNVNGGFPALLPLSGFESASCAPKYGETEQRMVSYRAQVDAGATLTLPETTTEASSFVIFSKVGELPDPWCPNKAKKFGCGGPCPPTICKCVDNL